MHKLLNTLYVTTPDAYLSKDGTNVVVSIKQEEHFRIPIQNIEGIVTFGYMGASPGLMKLCADNNVSLCFLSPSGRYIGRFVAPTHGNVLLRISQHEAAKDSILSLHFSSLFVAGKIQNYRNVLQRCQRDYGEDEALSLAINQLNYSKRQALKVESKEELLGIEGNAANTYFSLFNKLIRQQKSDFIFNGRNRRPPRDPINSLLSFSYTLLANEVQSALETVGIDPYIGFFHSLRPGRPSMALDMMEELRAYLGDRFVLSLINKRQLCLTDFTFKGDSPILTDSGRKTLLTAWQQRKRETVIHPFLNESVPIGLIPYIQAKLLAKCLRNDLNDYPVFIVK